MHSCLALRLSVLFSLGTLFLTSCGPERGRGETAVVSTAVIDSCADAETPGLEVSVYSNGPDNCFGVDGWGTFDPAQTAVVHSGATAVSFVPSNWSGLSFGRSGLRTSFSGVELWAHGGSTGGQLVKLEVKAGGKTVARTSLAAALGEPLPAGEWRKVTVTFAQPTLSSSLWIVLEATTGDQQAAIYLDDVRLATTSAGSCATGAPAGSSCSDANLCNGDEYCDGDGHCLQGVAPQTDDSNPCTLDSCDPVAGVQHQPLPAGTSCTYESTCSGVGSCDGAGSCQTGVAAADLRVYSDSLEACFVDWSESIHDLGQWTTVHSGYRAVSYEPDNWRSLDFHRDSLSGSYHAVEFWVNGGAAGGQQVWITVNNQGNQILSSRISDVLGQPIAAATWQRVLVPFPVSLVVGSFDIVFEAQTSLDQPTLFIDDVRLVSPSAPGPCDGAAAGASCADGNACNGDELCDGFGSCLAGTPPVLDDGNPCTADSCDVALGVRHDPVVAGTSCSDGNGCNGLEACDGAGVCTAGVAPVLDDGNPCTADACDPAQGVTHTPLASGTACSDGNACNGLETCNGAGTCLAGTALVVDDGNPCTVDSCDPVLGVVHTPAAAGTACLDDNLCNGNEACNGSGVCVAGAPPTIDDGDVCTADSCIPSTGVVHSPIPGCGVLPPDPTTVAPATDPTVATDIASATAFLYSGANPIQTGVAEGTIEARRVAVIRGLVKGRDGNPISGATITILGHTEYGQTLSRADGMFDMVVNGGGLVTVNYQKDGYLPAQRQVQAPWRDYVWADEVVLVPFDTMVSAVALGASITQVARGNPVTDTDGTRQATILFPPGTQASMVMADGTTQPLAAMHVRATEYTVGNLGRASMPAALPPASAYTYAVDLSVDEAVMGGATSVQFDRPVAFYVENFLGFPVGGIVPVGYYDRTNGVWVASENGKVIKIVSITGGLADLDTNGDDVADDAATLVALGVTAEERTRLAATYSVGASLWRVPITHFTPYDCNWPYGCDGDCPTPDSKPPRPPTPEPKPDCDNGSIIDCQNQGLGEVAEVAGTPYTIRYSSTRVPGYTAARTVPIPLSGDTVPSNAIGIEVTIEIAGRTISQSLPVLPNQTYVFTWDGKDAYGRPIQGEATATITVGWVYPVVYLAPSERSGSRSFGAMSASGGLLFMARNGMQFQRTQTWRVALASWDAESLGLGGWSLNIHHAFDVAGRRLLLGDGSQRSAEMFNGSVITTVAGTGAYGYSGDGGPATAANIYFPIGIAVGVDSALFIVDGLNHRIRRVGPDGIITTVAGTGTAGYGGDGGPATAALIDPKGVAVGTDGALFIADSNNHRIRRVGPDGIITTIAGTGEYGYSGDGGPATAGRIYYPEAVAVGTDGSLFIADSGNSRIRRVGPDGTITTVAGTGEYGCSGDGGPATAAVLNEPSGVAVGVDGALFIDDFYSRRIRRVGPDGIITTVAGTGNYGYSGDGGPATEAMIDGTKGVAVGTDGAFFIADPAHCRIRRVGPDGIITTVAGTGTAGYGGDGGPATAAKLFAPLGVAIGSDGALFIADQYSHRIRMVRPPFSGWGGDDFLVGSEDGSEVFLFDRNGRHLKTFDATTGVVHYTFGYDANGHLASVTDVAGNITIIERTGDTITAIVAPLGQRTALTVDGKGYLATITNPANESRSYSYDASGLMKTFTDPRSNVHAFQYDNLGRLFRDENPAGGSKQLSRTEHTDGYSVSVTTALGRSTLHDVTRLSTGDERRTLTQPDGTATVSTEYTNGTKDASRPDGTISTKIYGPDPRFGMQSPVVSSTVQTPAGVSRSMVESRTAALATPNDPLSATSLGETVTVNGRVYSSTYTASTRTLTSTTPAGRAVTTVLNDKGRLSQFQPPGVNAVSFGYDTSGRLQTATQGTRTYTIGYDAQGYPQTITDPLSRTVSFTYDQAGRVQTQTLPGSRTVTFGYDRSGNLTSLTPPGRPAHGFGYTTIDLTASYTPPAASNTGLLSTSYNYDLDGALSGVLLPDESTIVPGYDTAGRLGSVTSSRGTTSLGYDTAGRVATVTTADTGLSYGYDGFLTTSETTSGTFTGTVGWTYDNDFRVSTTSVNGSPVTYQYDADSLLTGAGALTLTRESATGRISGTTLGSVTTSQGYNGYGELESYGASRSGTSLYSYTISRDAAGRIDGKTETVQGATDAYVYGYDAAGRLATVSRNGVQTASYLYDANGNRQQKTSSAGTETGSYDDQDRMYGYGSASYTYRPNGELATKTVSGQTTTYDYDAFGNLRGVVLPDGTAIEYVVDGQNRRIGKKVNGTLAEGFLYENQLRPVAWLDGTGIVKARFVYGTRVNVPEYMVTSTATYRIVTDHLGSPRLVTDTTSGAVAQRVDYDEWGIVLADSNPGFQPFGFAGGLFDRDTGLVRFGARDYDAGSGRWMNKDPIRFRGGSTNLYEYAANDPINLADATGRFFNVGVGIGAAIVGGLVNGFNAVSNGQSFWSGAGVGAAAGFIGGLTLNPFILGALVGGVTTAGNRYLLGITNCRDARWDFAVGIGGGAIAGWLGGGLGEVAFPEGMSAFGAQFGGATASILFNDAVNIVNLFTQMAQ